MQCRHYPDSVVLCLTATPVRQCRPGQSVHAVAAQFGSTLFASTLEIVNNDIKYVLSSRLKLKFIIVSALRVHWIRIRVIMSNMIRVKYTC